MKMTHKHDVYFSPHSTEAHSLVMQIADYCNKRGIWYKISESTLGIGIVYGGNVGYVINADRKTELQTEREIAKAIVHKMIDDAVIAEDAYPDLRQKMHDAVDEYEPQTERSE